MCFQILFIVQLILSGGKVGSSRGVTAQLTIDATTPSSTTDGTPNTVMGVVGSSVVSSLLDSGSNALLWGVVPSDSVIVVCQQIVDSGSDTVTATVNHNWGDGPESLTFQVVATGGCLAASDGSGTEIVSVDQYNHKNAIVCGDNAGQEGCAIWVTGPDVDRIFNDGVPNDILNNIRKLLGSNGCGVGSSVGLTVGYIAGVLGASIACLSTDVAIPFLAAIPLNICIAGLFSVSVLVGGGTGCVAGFAVQQACFPGDALVQLQGGQFLPIMHLQVGDKVSVWEPSSSNPQTGVTYDEVYALGHKNAFVRSPFYMITMRPEVDAAGVLDSRQDIMNSTRTLEISALHFLPTMQTTRNGNRQVLHKRAKDVQIGEYLWAATSLGDNRNSSTGEVQLHVVTAISVIYKQGLYNPLTLRGSIVVNGVVASVHSDWFLDNVFEKLGLPSSALPYAYQAVLAPPRMLYRMWPRKVYRAVYSWLDTHHNVPKLYGHASALTFTASFSVIWSLLLGSFLYRWSLTLRFKHE